MNDDNSEGGVRGLFQSTVFLKTEEDHENTL